jgi:hypothetical protein
MDVHEILKLADEDLYRVKKERKARPSNLVLLPAQTCDQPGKSMTAAVQA